MRFMLAFVLLCFCHVAFCAEDMEVPTVDLFHPADDVFAPSTPSPRSKRLAKKVIPARKRAVPSRKRAVTAHRAPPPAIHHDAEKEHESHAAHQKPVHHEEEEKTLPAFRPSLNTVIGSVGVGTVERKPDRAILYVTVSTKGTTTKETREQHTIRTIPIRAVIHAFFARHKKNPANKVLHESLSINPEFRGNYASQQPDGFKAMTEFSIQTVDVDDVGSLIDDVTSAEATIGHVSMTLSPGQELIARNEARKQAVKAAIQSCQEMAQAANLKVSRIVSISDEGMALSRSATASYAEASMEKSAARGGGLSYTNENGILKFSASVAVQVEASQDEEK